MGLFFSVYQSVLRNLLLLRQSLLVDKNILVTRPQGYKTFFMFNSAEHEIFNAH